MNKTSASKVDPRLQQLEAELAGDELARQDEIETGTRKVRENTPWQRSAMRRNRMLHMRQGRRRRNPKHLLNQHLAIKRGTKNINSKWEEALMADHDREQISKEYKKIPELGLLMNQVGLVATANKNFTKSKNKLSDTHLIGV